MTTDGKDGRGGFTVDDQMQERLRELVPPGEHHVDFFVDVCGITRRSVHGWFKGKQISIGSLDKIYEAIPGVSVDRLMYGDGDEPDFGARDAAKQAVGEIQSQLETLDSILSRVGAADVDRRAGLYDDEEQQASGE